MKKKEKATNRIRNESSESMEKQAAYYDDHSLLEVGDMEKMKIVPSTTKKISIGIPQEVYIKAMGISTISGAGYQNVLKMAMVIGLNHLSQKTHQ